MTIALPMSVACFSRRLIMRHVFDASPGEIERRYEECGHANHVESGVCKLRLRAG